MENRFYAGDIVIFYKLENSPKMVVKEIVRTKEFDPRISLPEVLNLRVVTNFKGDDENEEVTEVQQFVAQKLQGVLCQWFDTFGVHHEKIFSTKDLKKC